MERARTAVEEDHTSLSRNELIERYAPLAKVVASKISQRLPSSVDRDDLISAGVIGLIDAIDKYDAEKSKNFKKYAEIRIRGAILDELRSLDWMSRSVRRDAHRLEAAKRKLRDAHGRDGTADEMAAELGVELAAYHKLLHKLQPRLLLSFDDVGMSGDGEKRSLAEYIKDTKAADPSMVVHFQKLRGIVGEQIQKLPEKQRIVVTLYYFEQMNLKEIGKVLDVTESRVSQLHSQAVEKLKAKVRRHFTKLKSMSPAEASRDSV
jgi:RNA polymerase sigma factor for flagellar operon FliA